MMEPLITSILFDLFYISILSELSNLFDLFHLLNFSNLSNSFNLALLENLSDLSKSFVYSIYFIFVSVVHVKDNYPKVEMELSNDCIQR